MIFVAEHRYRDLQLALLAVIRRARRLRHLRPRLSVQHPSRQIWVAVLALFSVPVAALRMSLSCVRRNIPLFDRQDHPFGPTCLQPERRAQRQSRDAAAKGGGAGAKRP